MSIKPSHILGMNARYYYTKKNSSEARRYGFSKLATKELLQQHGIPTPQLYHLFTSSNESLSIDWRAIPVPFVIKPASGSAGKGILLIQQYQKEKNLWLDQDGETLTTEDFELHIANILDGEFSTWGSMHRALIEELVESHSTLAKISYHGTADVRIIVFNSVPVMAMVRVPTKESQGKANLDRGAVGLGIDLATGITTYGIHGKSGYITHFPGKKRKVNGIVVPFWTQALEMAVRAANAAGYHYMGADLFIHQTKGPMVVELNGFPGLSIQLCNRAGLKRRLERVEGLDIRDPAHGVKVAKALFAEAVSDKIKVDEGLRILPLNPKVLVYGEQKQSETVLGRINTGKFRSAISSDLAERLGLVDLDDLLWRQQEITEGKVPVVEVTIKIKGQRINTAMLVVKRLNRTKHKIELGRKDTQGFLIGDEE